MTSRQLRAVHALISRLPVALTGNPFEVWAAALFVVVGFPQLLSGARPASVGALLPGWLVRVWAFELVVGGALCVVGVLRRNMPVERAGLAQLAAASLVYALAVLLIVPGWTGGFPAAFIGGYGLACLARLWTLYTAERIVRVLRDGGEL